MLMLNHKMSLAFYKSAFLGQICNDNNLFCLFLFYTFIQLYFPFLLAPYLFPMSITILSVSRLGEVTMEKIVT